MRVREDYRSITGQEKAAIFLMSLSQDQASKIFANLDDEEIKEISQSMSGLGTVSSEVIERLFVEFDEQVSSAGSLIGRRTAPSVCSAIFSARKKSARSWRRSAGRRVAPCGTSWPM